MTGAVIPAGEQDVQRGPERLAERVMLGVCVERGWVFARSTELQIIQMMLAFARSSACPDVQTVYAVEAGEVEGLRIAAAHVRGWRSESRWDEGARADLAAEIEALAK